MVLLILIKIMKCKLIVFLDRSTVILLQTYYNYNKISKKIDDILNANLELEESKAAMEVLGIEFIEKIDVKLPDLELNHNILVFKKVKNTPSKYPRKAGKPSKNPIK